MFSRKKLAIVTSIFLGTIFFVSLQELVTINTLRSIIIELLLFINEPKVYPIFYWITYSAAVMGIFSVIFVYGWYLINRKKFRTPRKKGIITAPRLYGLSIILIYLLQRVLAYFYLKLLLQISFYMFITGTTYLVVRSFIYMYTSLLYRYNWRRSNNPYVSLIVPAYNEGMVIQETMNSLLSLDYEPLEIIVVDDGSTDDTAEILDGYSFFPQVRILHQENGGKWKALNNGIIHAIGKIIVCIDADTTLHPMAISRMASHFSRDEVVAVAGNVKVGNRISQLTKLQALEYISGLNILKRSEAFFDRITVIPGPLGAFRKSDLLAVGLFSDDTFAEDADLTYAMIRLNGKMIYDPTAIGYTEAPVQLTDLLKQRYRWYRGLLQAMLKHKDMNFNPKYNKTGMFFIPWTYLNNLIFSWFSYFVSIWLFLLMFVPNTGFVIYDPNPIPPEISSITVEILMARGLGVFINLDIANIIPSIYIIWFMFFLIVDLVFILYSLRVDFKENLSIVPYVLHYKLFYGYLIDTFRILSHMEEFLNYPMQWESAKRTNTMSFDPQVIIRR